MADHEMPDELPDPVTTLWYLIRRVATLMDRAGEAMFRSELDISLAQFLVLSVVDAYPGPLSQQAVADRLSLTKGTISRQIDAATRAGLMTAETARHTRREKAVKLTKKGTALVRRGDALVEQSRAAMTETLTAKEIDQTVRVLATLLHALQSANP